MTMLFFIGMAGLVLGVFAYFVFSQYYGDL